MTQWRIDADWQKSADVSGLSSVVHATPIGRMAAFVTRRKRLHRNGAARPHEYLRAIRPRSAAGGQFVRVYHQVDQGDPVVAVGRQRNDVFKHTVSEPQQTRSSVQFSWSQRPSALAFRLLLNGSEDLQYLRATDQRAARRLAPPSEMATVCGVSNATAASKSSVITT